MPVVDSIWPVTEVYTYTYGPVENMGLFQIVEIVEAGFWDLGWVLVFGGEGDLCLLLLFLVSRA